MTIRQENYPREGSRAVKNTLIALAVALLAGLASIAWFAPSAGAALGATGQVNPDTGFPFWYEDTNGLRLDLCLDGPPNCLAAAGELVPPDGEAFWFQAEASMPTVPGTTNALLTLATEAAFADAGAGQESAFDRVRIRANVATPGTYTVTHPYGTKSFTVAAGDIGPAFEINDTVDFGCAAPIPGVNTCADGIPPDFDLAARGAIGPFLTWNTFGLPPAQGGPPLGFIGDAATPHAVTGSPTGNNLFRIVGPGVNASTNLFTVQGKISGPFATARPKGTIFNGSVSVFLLANDPTTKIHYTTNGTAPTTASPSVTGSGTVPINATTTLRFFAINASGTQQSRVFAETYTKNAPPTITGFRPTGSTDDRTPLIGAIVRDGQSNLVEGNVKLFVDGRAVGAARFAYSPSTDRLTHVSRRLGLGRHTVRVVATDPQGLVAAKSWRFRVIR